MFSKSLSCTWEVQRIKQVRRRFRSKLKIRRSFIECRILPLLQICLSLGSTLWAESSFQFSYLLLAGFISSTGNYLISTIDLFKLSYFSETFKREFIWMKTNWKRIFFDDKLFKEPSFKMKLTIRKNHTIRMLQLLLPIFLFKHLAEILLLSLKIYVDFADSTNLFVKNSEFYLQLTGSFRVWLFFSKQIFGIIFCHIPALVVPGMVLKFCPGNFSVKEKQSSVFYELLYLIWFGS